MEFKEPWTGDRFRVVDELAPNEIVIEYYEKGGAGVVETVPFFYPGLCDQDS